jgi:hypothetical protein
VHLVRQRAAASSIPAEKGGAVPRRILARRILARSLGARRPQPERLRAWRLAAWRPSIGPFWLPGLHGATTGKYPQLYRTTIYSHLVIEDITIRPLENQLSSVLRSVRPNRRAAVVS